MINNLNALGTNPNTYMDPYQGFNQSFGRPRTWKETFLGSDPRLMAVPSRSPQQMNIMNFLSQLGGQGMQGLYGNMMRDPYEGFQDIANQATRNFQQQTLPSIMERFTQMGAQSSSAFPQILGSAGANLQQNLAGMKQEYGNQRLGQQGAFLNSLLNQGLQQQFSEPVKQEGEPGFARQGLQSIAQFLPYLMYLL